MILNIYVRNYLKNSWDALLVIYSSVLSASPHVRERGECFEHSVWDQEVYAGGRVL